MIELDGEPPVTGDVDSDDLTFSDEAFHLGATYPEQTSPIDFGHEKRLQPAHRRLRQKARDRHRALDHLAEFARNCLGSHAADV